MSNDNDYTDKQLPESLWAKYFQAQVEWVNLLYPRPGLGISYPEDYRYPENPDDPDYFDPAWKSC